MSHPPSSSSSSHLNESKEAFVMKLAGAKSLLQGLSPSTIANDLHRTSSVKKLNADDSEIDVFDAEKYFSQGSNQSPKLFVTNSLMPANSLHLKKLDPLEINNGRAQLPASNNSRSMLLQHNVPRVHQPKRTMKKRFLSGIGCDLSCCDKNFVDIDDAKNEGGGGGARKNCSVKSTEQRTISVGSRQVDDHLLVVRKSPNCVNKFDEENGRFSFQLSNSQSMKKQMNEEVNGLTKPESPQVFGSPIQENGPKRTVSPWDKPVDAESDSDSSSDLFEIESFAKSSNPFLKRQEETPHNGLACDYAPSEASIEWSVVTASAADFSVLSDSEDLKSNSNSKLTHHQKEMGLKSKIRSVDERNNRRPSGLFMGCKSHKAVSVVGEAHEQGPSDIITSRHHSRRAESFTQMTRFYDESKKTAQPQFSHARNRQRSLDALGLPQP